MWRRVVLVRTDDSKERIATRATVATYLLSCKIWGFHGGDYEEWCLLGCYAVWLL
jgi:hypothetical protein